MKRISYLIFYLTLAGVIFFAGRGCRDGLPAIVTRVDTLVIRDTVRDTVFVPIARHIVRTDTVWMQVARDTVRIEVEVPVERKIYETESYRAVVEGFRPMLVEMEVYRNTTLVTRETTFTPARQKPGRWGVGIQAGYGISTQGLTPYVGIGVQYSILTW